MSANPRSLFVIDGSGYVFRAYYASPPLTASDGTPTNGVLVFTNMLMALLREQQPDLVAVTFDPPPPSFRHGVFPDYKANRQAPPPNLVAQFPLFRQVVVGLGIPVLEVPGFEADDVIATLVRHARGGHFVVTIVSGDKDLMQLVRDGQVRMLDTMGRSHRLYTEAEVRERFQVGPERVADVLGLAGDSSDNIPGVPGIGPKTAGKLVAEFGSLEAVLQHVDQISGAKRQQSLREFADQARLSKQLATLRDDVPIALDEAALARHPVRRELLLPLFERLEFHRLIEDLELRAPITAKPAAEPLPELDAPTRYTLVLSLEDLERVTTALQTAPRFAFALVGSHDDAVRAHLVGLALSWEPRQAAYIPLAHRTLCAPPQLDRSAVIERLRSLFEDRRKPKVCHRYTHAWGLLSRYGVDLRGVWCDTALASYLIDAGRDAHHLAELAEEALGLKALLRPADVAGAGKKAKRFDHVEVEDAAPWACQDADVALMLAARQRVIMEERQLDPLHDTIEVPLARVLARVQRTGVRIDETHLAALSDELLGTMKQLEAQVQSLLGRTINLNSPKQLSELLFDELALKPANKKKTTHGYSTDQASLEAITDQHPLPQLIIDYRTVAKLRSTYTDALPTLVNPETGRIHTHFNQTVAATGRLSSSDPNLQNIPVRTEQGRRIRGAFLPAEGWTLLAADYSQVELRLMAHFSEDPVLIEAFQLGQDIHRRTAAEIFDLPLEMVSRAQRGVGKTINFGVLYGMGITRLARETNATRDEARDFMKRFDERFARVRAFFDTLVQSATRNGYVTTLLGRRRYLPELRSARREVQALGQRLAINTPIQGTAADLMKLAMIRVDERMSAAQCRARMLLQVHDELVFECPPDEVATLAELVRTEMEHVADLRVRLAVDVSTGPDWATMKAL